MSKEDFELDDIKSTNEPTPETPLWKQTKKVEKKNEEEKKEEGRKVG